MSAILTGTGMAIVLVSKIKYKNMEWNVLLKLYIITQENNTTVSSFIHIDINNTYCIINYNINCKALKGVILGMAISSKV